MTGLKTVVILFAGFSAIAESMAAQVPVRVAPAHLQGPRSLEEQTQAAVIRDYLQAWQGFHAALEQNRPELLEGEFVGTARDRLADTIQQQGKLGIRTRYQDRSHNVQITCYTPDGLSIELTDNVEYDVQLIEHEKLLTTQRERARYVVVLTPAEVRWKVRVFQSVPE
jgi:hypothetical protein